MSKKYFVSIISRNINEKVGLQINAANYSTDKRRPLCRLSTVMFGGTPFLLLSTKLWLEMS